MIRRLVVDWWKRVFPGTTLGRRGEAAAERFLRRRGLQTLARGTRSFLGELDLVMLDRQTIVFVEVKTRQSVELGHPVEAVGPEKQRRLTRAALGFLKRHRLLECPCRFDVVGVVWPENERSPHIEHFPNAFEAAGSRGAYS
ncbi:MAG: YraN family protein [Planctomycetaceae bacterium]|nr:YraN family protein [Planctomycetaceae bacterium]